jgi:hypothetical protein
MLKKAIKVYVHLQGQHVPAATEENPQTSGYKK